jgi:hypothetical protein
VTEEGKNEVTRRFRDQTGGDGIIDALEDQLDTDRDIHVVETESTSQVWGEDEQKSREWTYEQGDVRISAADGEGDDVPKQWRLEKQAGDVYRAQTFVEGAEDFTTITERRSDGRTVTETSTSRGQDEDGEDYEVESTSRTSFGADGQVVGQHLDRTEPDGSRSVLDYSRTTDAQGQIRELTRSELTDAEGHVTSAERESQSVMVNGQEKVTSLRTTVNGPGGTATSSFTERGGQQLTVNGKPVPLAEGSPELDALSEEEKELAAQAATDVLKNVKTAAEQGKNVLELTKVTGVGANPNYTRGDALPDALNRKIELNKIRLGQRFGEARVEATQEALLRGASGAKAGVGALGALASGAALISDIQQHNWLKAGIDAGGVAVGSANVVAGARELSALRATPNGALAIDDLGSVAGKFGTFAKFGGLAVGLAAGGYQVVDGIVKGDGVSIAQGGVGIAGTLGAFAAGGAVDLSGARTGPAAGRAGPHPSIHATTTWLNVEWSQDGSRGRQSRTAPVHPRHDDVANSSGARTGPAAGRAGPHPSIHATTTWRVRVEPGRVPRPAEPDRTRPSTPRRRGEFEWSQDGSRGRQSRTAPVHPRHDDVARAATKSSGLARAMSTKVCGFRSTSGNHVL